MPTKPQHACRYKSIPTFLRVLRDEAGFTQRQLARHLDEPQSWVYKCETGLRRVDVAEFCDWCRACGIKPEAAIGRFVGTSLLRDTLAV